MSSKMHRRTQSQQIVAKPDWTPEELAYIANERKLVLERSSAGRHAIPVRYKNFRGVERVRKVIPLRLAYVPEGTEFHDDRVFFLVCIDPEDGREKFFSLTEMDFRILGKDCRVEKD